MSYRPPHSPSAEAALIGAALADPTRALELHDRLFYDERHKAVASVIRALAEAGEPISETTVVCRAGAHMTLVVGTCVEACHSPANWSYWLEELTVKAQLRDAWLFHQKSKAEIEAIPTNATVGESRSQLAALETEFVRLTQADSVGGLEDDPASIINSLFDDLERQTAPVYLTTGLYGLDRLVRLRPGQLVVIAARPSAGKTALACTIASHVALRMEKPVGFVSLEMSRTEIMRRLASGLSGVPFDDFEKPDEAQRPQIVEALAALKRAPIRILDKGGLTVGELAGVARRWKVKHKIELLVVDYLGLLRNDAKGRSRYEDITEISGRMKQLARELDLTVLLLAQLNRAAAEEGETPRMHHLRDSGAIEQDADIVILLHTRSIQGSTRGVTAFIEKQRNGRLGEASLLLHGPTMRFSSESPISPADIPTQ